MLRGIFVRCTLFVATLALGFPLTIATLIAPGLSDNFIRLGRVWSRILLAACGARVTYRGLERVQRDAPRIYIANHQSMVDIWVMMMFLPPTTRFVAKRELFRVPVLGWALAACGCVPVDRGNRAEAIRSLERAAERIRAGQSVVLYPEGTRSPDGSLQAFKKGAFHLALAAGVPVIPVAITGSFRVMPPGALRVRPGPVDVWIEPEVDVGPFRPDNYNGLLDEVRGRIEHRFRQAAA